MTEIHDLLDRAVDHPAHLDVDGDLRRGRHALHRRRARVAGLAGSLTALGAVGLGASQLAARDHVLRVADQPGDQVVHTPYFDVPPPPVGWNVDASPPDTAVLLLTRDGAPSQGPRASNQYFGGKVALILEEAGGNSYGYGPTTRYHGRTFYDNERNASVSILAVRLRDGRWLQLQYPKSAGFETRQMIEYLDGVVVLPGAKGFGN